MISLVIQGEGYDGFALMSAELFCMSGLVTKLLVPTAK